MSHPGSPGHLRCPALSVIIPVDGGLRARRGRAPAAPTTQPTPGKCPAAARSMAGENPTHAASAPVTGMRVKN